MALLASSPLETLYSPESSAQSGVTTPEFLEPAWIHVLEDLPEDGDAVEVKLEQSGEIRIARRGHYQSTGAWFDAKTHVPIYETIVHWKARS